MGRMNEAENTVSFSQGRSAIIRDPGSEIAKQAINKAGEAGITELKKEDVSQFFNLNTQKNSNYLEFFFVIFFLK